MNIVDHIGGRVTVFHTSGNIMSNRLLSAVNEFGVTVSRDKDNGMTFIHWSKINYIDPVIPQTLSTQEFLEQRQAQRIGEPIALEDIPSAQNYVPFIPDSRGDLVRRLLKKGGVHMIDVPSLKKHYIREADTFAKGGFSVVGPARIIVVEEDENE